MNIGKVDSLVVRRPTLTDWILAIVLVGILGLLFWLAIPLPWTWGLGELDGDLNVSSYVAFRLGRSTNSLES